MASRQQMSARIFSRSPKRCDQPEHRPKPPNPFRGLFFAESAILRRYGMPYDLAISVVQFMSLGLVDV